MHQDRKTTTTNTMAMATTAVFNSRNLLLLLLPDLNISPRRTTSHALHRVHFVGVLQPWANFESDVMNTFNTQTWSLQHLDSRITGPAAAGSVDEEQVFVSNERGVQGRLEGRAGLVLRAAFRAQQLDLVLGDSRGALPPYRGYLRQPDFVMKTSSGVAKIVGEGKTHWIDEHEHDLDNALGNFEACGRRGGQRDSLGVQEDPESSKTLLSLLIQAIEQFVRADGGG